MSVVLITGILWLASGGALKTQYDLYLAIEDESVAGLNVNAPVKYNGVDVGKVRKIQLDPNNPDRVNLTFAIAHNTPIRSDTVAVLNTQGLTGIAYVELSSSSHNAHDTHNAPLLQKTPGYDYPVIRTKPSLGARLENVLTTVLASLDGTSKHINAILSDQNQENFKATLADMATISHTIAQHKEDIAQGLHGANQTMANSARLTAKAQPVLEQIGQSADSINAMGKEVSKTSISAAKSLNALGSGVQGVADVTLPELDRLISELNVLSASMRRLSEQTERSPNSLLFGIHPVPDGPGETPLPVNKP